MRTHIVILVVMILLTTMLWGQNQTAAESSIKPRQFVYSWHVGSTHPITNDKYYDANIHAAIDFAYRTMDLGFIKGIVGFNQLTTEGDISMPNPQWLNASINYQVLWPLWGVLYGYAQAGGGVYWPETGSSSMGYNVGLGFNKPVVAGLKVEWGVDFHNVAADEKFQFWTFHLGVIFP